MQLNIKEMFLRWKNFIIGILMILLLFATIFLAAQDYFLQKQVDSLRLQTDSEETDGKIVQFLNFFIEKVLNATGDVSFEDRLKLENMVRGLEDENILKIWNDFTQSENSEEVQKYCKDLLAALVRKLSY